MNQAVAAAGSGPFTPAAEQAIAAEWGRHATALRCGGTVVKAATAVAHRAGQAVDRLTPWPLLDAALKTREERAVLRAGGETGPMEQFTPAIPARRQVDDARRKILCLDQFEALAARADADDGRCGSSGTAARKWTRASRPDSPRPSSAESRRAGGHGWRSRDSTRSTRWPP